MSNDDVVVLLKVWADNTNDGMQRAVLRQAIKEIMSLRRVLKKTEYGSDRVFDGTRPLTENHVKSLKKKNERV